jgi:hypothetical protein
MKIFPTLALSLTLAVTSFAHSWSTIEDCENELNEAWQALPAGAQSSLRLNERTWIKYKDSLQGQAKMDAVIQRAGMLWGLAKEFTFEKNGYY